MKGFNGWLRLWGRGAAWLNEKNESSLYALAQLHRESNLSFFSSEVEKKNRLRNIVFA